MIKKLIISFIALTILSGCTTTAKIVNLGFVAAAPNQGGNTEENDE
jgi:hypothetical protein